MTEIENRIEPIETSETLFNVHDIFNKKDIDKPEIEQKKDIEPAKKEFIKKAKFEDIKKSAADIKEEDESEEDEPVKKEETKSKEEDAVYYKAELEKLQKSVKDTQKSFHENRKQLSAYRKAVEKMKEEGTLLDEEAVMLLDHTKFQDVTEEEPLFARYAKIWDKELPYITRAWKRYDPNSQIDQYILAFQHFIQTGSPEEVNDALSELAQYENNATEFTHQMLEIGRQYNEDIYSDIHEAGSIRSLKNKYSERESELQKKIDKLEKQYNKLKEKYEDYNSSPPNLRLPSGSANVDLPENVTFDPAAIFSRRFQSR